MIDQQRTLSIANLVRAAGASGVLFIFIVSVGCATPAYADSGVVEVSETEISESDVPYAVEEAFEESDYADWPVVEREKVQSKKQGTVYEIEVEKGGERYGLYFSPDGERLGTEEEHHEEGHDEDHEEDHYEDHHAEEHGEY